MQAISILISLSMMLPYWVMRHTQPNSAFYAEWLSAALFLLLLIVVFVETYAGKNNIYKRFSSSDFYKFSALPLSIVILIIFQYFGSVPDVGVIILDPFLLVAYGIAIFSVGMLARQVLMIIPLETVAKSVAIGLLMGGVVTVFMQLIQGLQWTECCFDLIVTLPANDNKRLSGNLFQANHQANYLMLGLASCWYLWESRIYKAKYIFLFSFILLIGAILTGSRFVYVEVLIIILFLCFYYYFVKGVSCKNIFIYVLVFMVFCFALQSLIVWLMQWVHAPILSSQDRLLEGIKDLQSSHVVDERWNIWRASWRIFMENWLFGVGWDGFVLSYAELTFGEGISNSSHNIFLDILVKFGLVGFILIFVSISPFVVNFCRNFNKIKSGFGGPQNISGYYFMICLLVIFIHSFFEYPLHYIFFLLPFFLFAYLNYFSTEKREDEASKFNLKIGKSFYAVVVVYFSGIAALLIVVILDYKVVEGLYKGDVAEKLRSGKPKLFFNAEYDYIKINSKLFFGVELSINEINENKNMADRALKLKPFPPMIRKAIVYRAVAGDYDGAYKLLPMLDKLRQDRKKSAEGILLFLNRHASSQRPVAFIEDIERWGRGEPMLYASNPAQLNTGK